VAANLGLSRVTGAEKMQLQLLKALGSIAWWLQVPVEANHLPKSISAGKGQQQQQQQREEEQQQQRQQTDASDETSQAVKRHGFNSPPSELWLASHLPGK